MPKSKTFLLGKNIEQKLHNTGFGNDLLNMTPKAQVLIKDETDKLDSWKVLNFVHTKTLFVEKKDKPQNGRKYLQITYMMRE